MPSVRVTELMASPSLITDCTVPLTLASDCEGTDDPLYGKEPLTSLQAGDKVTLLAFMGDEWAYVQIGLEGRVCRLFIPRSALSQN